MKKTIELTQLEANTIAIALSLYIESTQTLWDQERLDHYNNLIQKLLKQ